MRGRAAALVGVVLCLAGPARAERLPSVLYAEAVLALVETLVARGEAEEAGVWAKRYERELADDEAFLVRLE